MPHAVIARRIALVVPLLISSIAFAGCKPNTPAPEAKVDFTQPLPEGQRGLRKIPPEQYPDFAFDAAAVDGLVRSIDNSLKYMDKPSSGTFYPYLDIDHDRAVATLKAFREIVQQAPTTGAGGFVNDAIREKFEVYQSIGAPQPDGSGYTGRVLFTGYFTPIYDGSLTKTGEFQYPLYKAPSDLDRDPNTGEVRGRKLPDGTDVPYYTRQEIESGGKLAGNELVWLKSRWEAYVITVQGSARLRLSDGRIYEVGYAGTNGYPYSSPGQQMLQDGVITRDQLSLKGLGNYFAQHPEAMDKYLSVNQRFVFFTERPGGPFGSLNVPVTPFASIATDKQKVDIYPRAMPAFLVVPVPTSETGDVRPWRGFMMDQDTGGAIRASGRCDIYMGVGPEAEKTAGHELQEGQLYYIALKPELVPKYAAPTTAPPTATPSPAGGKAE